MKALDYDWIVTIVLHPLDPKYPDIEINNGYMKIHVIPRSLRVITAKLRQLVFPPLTSGVCLH